MYRVGELARAAGVNPRTVDFYTRMGLIEPEGRTDAKYRLYSEASLQRLKTIHELRSRKYSLEQIRTLLDRSPEDAAAEACKLQSELEHMLSTVNSLKGAPLDERTRGILTALALKGMALTQELLQVLHPEGLPPL